MLIMQLIQLFDTYHVTTAGHLTILVMRVNGTPNWF